MTQHAIDRIKERYNKELTFSDINKIVVGIKKERYVYLEKKILNERKTVLIKFENIPMKLVIDNKNNIITALPIDIDEANKYLNFIPELKDTVTLDRTSNKKLQLELEFKSTFSEEIIVSPSLSLNNVIEQNITLNVHYASNIYVILWHYCSATRIQYSIYAINTLFRRLRNKIINFVENNEFSKAKYLLELGETIQNENIFNKKRK